MIFATFLDDIFSTAKIQIHSREKLIRTKLRISKYTSRYRCCLMILIENRVLKLKNACEFVWGVSYVFTCSLKSFLTFYGP